MAVHNSTVERALTAVTSPVTGGVGPVEDKNSELLCPVCFELLQEAYVTRCGHSFCHTCIIQCVDLHRRCPKCGAALTSRDHVFPNFLLNELVLKRKLRGQSSVSSSDTPPPEALRSLVTAESKHLSMPDVDLMLEALTRRKRLLQAESRASQHKLLYDFLTHLHKQRTRQITQLTKENDLVKRDLDSVGAILKDIDPEVNITELESQPEPSPENQVEQEEFSTVSIDTVTHRWRRLHAHFDDFVQCYFAHRSDELYFTPDSPTGVAPPVVLDDPEPPVDTCKSATPAGLDAFREDLAAFTRYKALRPLATLSYSSDAINYSTIVSTIEFDKDDEFFAIAGVTKRIKVFEYAAVVSGGSVGLGAEEAHYPCAEMQCGHKVSCVAWNAYHKQVLAAADYEGTVSLWDCAVAARTRALQEHDKRAWSVHFSRADVRLLASGSDDARVKLWALNAERSVATLEARFNVCCVRFSPRSSCHLAFGSADHCVHYYDLRAPRAPLAVFRDHRKAVSYVKFLDADTLVSASTDSQLKLWRVDAPRCVRSFIGHSNEKNFVGLATDGKYVACGSENNALYVYYRGLSRPLVAYRFAPVRGFLERSREAEAAEFVSAVCWRKSDRAVLLAANSQGVIKLLELV